MASRIPKAAASVQQRENPVPITEDEIRRRAYELFEQRGREHGHDVDDWLRAEEEMTHKRSRHVAA